MAEDFRQKRFIVIIDAQYTDDNIDFAVVETKTEDYAEEINEMIDGSSMSNWCEIPLTKKNLEHMENMVKRFRGMMK